MFCTTKTVAQNMMDGDVTEASSRKSSGEAGKVVEEPTSTQASQRRAPRGRCALWCCSSQ